MSQVSFLPKFFISYSLGDMCDFLNFFSRSLERVRLLIFDIDRKIARPLDEGGDHFCDEILQILDFHILRLCGQHNGAV